MKEIKDNIKRKRTEKGMTQEELASKVYTTKSTISKWESGAITPGIDMLKIIAKALDTRFYELIGESTPWRMKIMDTIGRLFIYCFVWIHLDITFSLLVTILGFAAILVGALTSVGGWIAYIVMYSMTSWGDGSTLIVLGTLAMGPFMFAFWSLIGYILLNISRLTVNFSLKWFWRTNKRIKPIWRVKINKWMILTIILSFVLGAILLATGAAINPNQLNINFN